MNRPLILSSSSTARRALLARLGTPFISVSPDIDETALPNETPTALVQRLAKEKAIASATAYPNALIIGSDQVGCVDNQILGKPHTHTKAVEQLRFVSGKLITFYTGLCLLDSATGKTEECIEEYHVQKRVLTDDLIERYLAKEKPYHCAGSCHVEGLGISLIARLQGDDYTALIGLPLIRLTDLLEKMGFPVI